MDLRFILPFAILGMLLGFKILKNTIFLYIAVAATAFSISLFFITTKYRIAIVPFLIIFASFGAVSIWEALKNKKYRKFWLLCLGLIFIGAVLNYDKIFINKASVGTAAGIPNAYSRLFNVTGYIVAADYQGLIRELMRIPKEESNNHFVAFYYGLASYHLKDFTTAEQKFKEAIEINPLYIHAYYNLGFLYNRQKLFLKAKAILEKAVLIDPQDIGTHYELGLAYKSTANFKAAKREFEFVLGKLSRWRIQERALVEKDLIALGK